MSGHDDVLHLTPWEVRHPLAARLRVPGDKSLTHRAILFSALTRGHSRVEGWLDAADTRASLRLVQALGVEADEATEGGCRILRLTAPGPDRLQEPDQVVDCANSGTTMRLGMGLAAGVRGLTVLTGDASLRRRPMGRVLRPLAALGARVCARGGEWAPVAVEGGRLAGGRWTLEVASAQVKSALILAGLQSRDGVEIREPEPTRDHSERLLRMLGAQVQGPDNGVIRVAPLTAPLAPFDLRVPGDPSSAAFWAALAALVPGWAVTVEGVLLNPTRTGFFRVLARMGARVELEVEAEQPEPVGRITVEGRPLQGVEVAGQDIPSLIDEAPLIALVASRAAGRTRIRGAEELRVKESDRIAATAGLLRTLGVAVEERPDGLVVEGPSGLHGGTVDSHGDHRLAMLAALAAAVARGPVTVRGARAVSVSYPSFFRDYRVLAAAVTGNRYEGGPEGSP
ncbi:MAG: 3-phosphoshikimate 1-carboxyvinyltransferase [Firmicutes bacterium]|nr:3-phosphoshikimate 1-carboxyvinyltransferase [Bacillota bacterium]